MVRLSKYNTFQRTVRLAFYGYKIKTWSDTGFKISLYADLDQENSNIGIMLKAGSWLYLFNGLEEFRKFYKEIERITQFIIESSDSFEIKFCDRFLNNSLFLYGYPRFFSYMSNSNRAGTVHVCFNPGSYINTLDLINACNSIELYYQILIANSKILHKKRPRKRITASSIAAHDHTHTAVHNYTPTVSAAGISTYITNTGSTTNLYINYATGGTASG